MTYLVQNNKAYLNGSIGYYDRYIQNPSVKYGRNAAKNNADYNNEFSNISFNYGSMLPPLEFEYRYMPTNRAGMIDSMALMGAAFEEMGARPYVKSNELDAPIKEAAAQEIAKEGVKDSPIQNLAQTTDSRIVDLNNDGVIDTAEYAATILASDMFSKQDGINPANITGVINNAGMNKTLGLMNVNNADYSRQCLSYLYTIYNLGQAQAYFYSNPNNTLDIRG